MYPRRFYRRTKSGRALKYPENTIASCRWCGTYFIEYPHKKDYCSKKCKSLVENMGEVSHLLVRKKKKK
jgi:hypothetical protein